MDKLNSTKFKEYLHQLLKIDYTVGLYKNNEHVIQVSYNHLNSVHNALAFIDLQTGKTFIDRQYTTQNKRVEKIITNILEYCKTYYTLQKNLVWIESEFTYYKNLAQQIYNCKYSLETGLHTQRGA